VDIPEKSLEEEAEDDEEDQDDLNK